MNRGFVLAALLLLSTSSPGLSQEIRGTVFDAASGEPLQNAVLTVLNADSAVLAATLSDGNGVFRIRVPANDSLRLRAQRFGYAPERTALIALAREDTLEVRIRLRPEALPLEGITVTAPNRNLERFLRDQQMGFGLYLGPEEIARLEPRSTTQLLVGMAGSPLLPGRNWREIEARSRGVPPRCTPTVFVDGSELRGISVESAVPARTVRGVAVYRNPHNAPVEFQRPFMNDCPVVVIWTDHGFGFIGGSRK